MTKYVNKYPNSEFEIIGSFPKRFALKSSHNLLQGTVAPPIDFATKEQNVKKYSESDLHPFLAYFAYKSMKTYTKTILHSKSTKRGQKSSEWMHPDMVGAYYSFVEWSDEVASLTQELGIPLASLYSFELKKELNLGNLRECFFQAVSNSSWANEGYLVAATIPKKEEFRSELKRLSIAFGIGIIQLDIEDPDNSSTILPARSKSEIDWSTVNELSQINVDFQSFIKRVKIDTSSKEIRKERYDKVLEANNLISSVKFE